jgi:hypothetical protein
MLDFFTIATRTTKNGKTEVYPKFIMKKSEDLMIRGGDFYAIWMEDRGLWSTDEQDVINLVDREIAKYIQDHKGEFNDGVRPLYMWDAESGMIDTWHKYCQRQCRDNYNALDEKLIFSNTETNKKDFASKRLSYPLEPGSIEAWDKLISTLYDEDERHKIEWAIGSIVTGDSKKIQKFMVFYGEAGTGKSTILNVIQQLFDGYHTVFDAKALGSNNNAFALEAFKTNPLVAIQHDGDLSRIEDNTRLNSLVSHETMPINEKFKGLYNAHFICFLFMGTNRPVKITDGKSGLLRRLIDVSPSGRKLGVREYKKAVKQVEFELGAIAHHCREVYLDDPGAYDSYVPIGMMGASNDFYNFILDSYHVFKREDGTTLKAAWEMYKTYVEEAKVSYPFSQRNFKEELKNYFKEFNERFETEDGSRLRSYYHGFRLDKFEISDNNRKRAKTDKKNVQKEAPKHHLIQFDAAESLFDKECAGCFAQYASSKETPTKKWDDVTATLSQLDTTRLHYVKVPENHIVIDFDIKDESGNKSFQKNLEEASKWPATYAELSKSGAGIHLHYIYTGDVSKLSRVSDDNENIEIKVFTGKSSLRRMLTKCNTTPIATISSGLPLKGDDKVINFDGIKNEKMLRTLLKRNLAKEYGSTRCSIDFIYNNLEDAYNSGISYDVSDMKNAVFAFAANSTNQADYCLKLVNKMRFKSEEPSEAVQNDEAPIVFYDVEVFPNLFLVNWKIIGEGRPIVRMINPSPSDIERLLHYRLVGFNCRRYDNHMLYARLMGYDNMQMYNLSQKIVNSKKGESLNNFFSEAYNISYTDIYDYASKKQSLKKWEIELGIHHQELGLPWDKPVPEDKWAEVAEYCDNDVIATEAVWNATQADFVARQIQVDLVRLLHGTSNVSVNDTTNSLSQKIIFGNNRKPQSEFNYRDMSQPVGSDQYEEYRRKFGDDYDFRVFDDNGMPTYRSYIPGEKLPKGYSILPFFKGYKYERGKSTYLGEEIGEGGRVFARPGMYGDVWDGDIASQHPHSIIFERLFGPTYTKRFEEIVQARVAIKHKDFDNAGSMLGGALKPYLNEEQAGGLAQALKIVINSIYGLTKAAFTNPFRDNRNIDNIVAKRGALFMTLLKNEVEKRGFVVAHVKTDSIKIPDATEEIKDFVYKFGKEYDYTFETEANFEKFCLVNNAVYIAKFKDGKQAGKWTATGAQFAVPYVFKKLFSKEDVVFEDMCETKEVQGTAIYLDMNEELPDVSKYETLMGLRMKTEDQLNKSESRMRSLYSNMSDDELTAKIAEGHNRIFVGRVGNFCPIKPGCGGADLVKEMKDKDGNVKYDSVTGAKGYRWLESEMVRTFNKENDIDRSYYDKLVDAAVETISQFGDFSYFASDDPYVGPPFLDGRPCYCPMDLPVDDPAEIPWYSDDQIAQLFDRR